VSFAIGLIIVQVLTTQAIIRTCEDGDAVRGVLCNAVCVLHACILQHLHAHRAAYV